MSQEQQDQEQQVGTQLIAPDAEERVEEAAGVINQTSAGAMNGVSTSSQRKRPKKQATVVSEEAIMARSARPSFWPLLLALALVVLLVGAISNIAILILGVVLVVVTIVGWGIERR